MKWILVVEAACRESLEGDYLERGGLRGKGRRRDYLEDWEIFAGFSLLKHLHLHPVPLWLGFGVATVT